MTIWASRKAAQSALIAAGSDLGLASSQLYQAHKSEASSIHASPGTSCTASNCSQSPRDRTTATPVSASTAPRTARPETGALKNKRPSSNIHTGVLDATSVTFMGEDVLSARYCRELYKPTPSNPSSAKRRQCGHKGLPGRSTQPAMGS